MRAFASLVAALCTIGWAMPAHALGMQYCNDIKGDDQARMACLQEHITHLEQSLVALGGRLATLETALQNTLAVNKSYKLRSLSQGKCLGLDGTKDDELALVSCDTPDSWMVTTGAPIKKPAKTASPAPEAGTNAAAAGGQQNPANASQPQGKGSNPCKNLDQVACTAKTGICVWKAEKNKCGRPDKTQQQSTN
jgi:hypothetical protein